MSATTRLLFTRHGDSWHKRDGITGGPASCRGLTPEGREQASRLSERLARDPSVPADLPIYASVLPRAVETARTVAAALGRSADAVRTDCRLCTWHIPPEWDGLPWETVKSRHSQSGGGVFRPFEDGSESWAELTARVGRGLWEIAQRHAGQTALVVAHTEVVHASFVALGQLSAMVPFEVRVGNASLTEWTTDEDPSAWPPARWTLARCNDDAHLRG